MLKKNTVGLPDTRTVSRPTSSRVGCPAEVPALASNPLGPAFTRRRWYVHQYLGAQHSHNAAGTSTSNERGLASLAGGARLSRVLPPLDHHGEPTLNVVLKRHSAADPWPQEPLSHVLRALFAPRTAGWNTCLTGICLRRDILKKTTLQQARGGGRPGGFFGCVDPGVIADTLASFLSPVLCALGSSRIHSHLHGCARNTFASVAR